MKTRVALAAALITVLVATGCNNKTQYCEPAATVMRTKNKSLNWATPAPTTIYGEVLARSC